MGTHAGRGHVGEIMTLGDFACLEDSGLQQAKAASEQSEELICMQFFTPFWTPLCYIIHIFNLKAFDGKPTGNEWGYISLWSDILWTLRVLVLMLAYLRTMETSPADQYIKFSVVYFILSTVMIMIVKKPNDIWFSSTLVYYIWSTWLAFDLWMKWRCIWKGSDWTL